eukprot:13159691-Alexandrium_andersonii.AAC.1
MHDSKRITALQALCSGFDQLPGFSSSFLFVPFGGATATRDSLQKAPPVRTRGAFWGGSSGA